MALSVEHGGAKATVKQSHFILTIIVQVTNPHMAVRFFLLTLTQFPATAL